MGIMQHVFNNVRIGYAGKGTGGKLTIDKGATLTNNGTIQHAAGSANVLLVGTKPATCTVGQIMADSADSNKLYQCTATNTWTKVGTQT